MATPTESYPVTTISLETSLETGEEQLSSCHPGRGREGCRSCGLASLPTRDQPPPETSDLVTLTWIWATWGGAGAAGDGALDERSGTGRGRWDRDRGHDPAAPSSAMHLPGPH